MSPMEWLKTAIEDAGGVPKVAIAAGLSEEHLYNILAERRRVTPKTAAQLAAAMPSLDRGLLVMATMGATFAQKDAPSAARQQRSKRVRGVRNNSRAHT